MRLFFTVLAVCCCAYFGFELGYYLAKKGVVEMVIMYSCDKIMDRQSFEQCSLAIKEKLQWRR